MEIDEAYEILEVNKFVSIDDIKKSYKRLCLKYHPDKQNGDENKFIKIQKAYELLKLEHDNNINFYILLAYFIQSLSTKMSKNIVMSIEVPIEDIYNKLVKKIKYTYFNEFLRKDSRVVYLELDNCKDSYTVEGYGDFNPVSGEFEDLVIKMEITNNNFEHLHINKILNSEDIYTTVKINIYEYFFGLKRSLKYFNGEEIELTYIPYMDGNTEVKKEKGIDDGNLYIFYDIDLSRYDANELQKNKEIIEKIFNK